MHNKPPPKLRLRDFLRDLRRADPMFWIVAAIVTLVCFLRWLLP